MEPKEKYKQAYKKPLHKLDDKRVELPKAIKQICCPTCNSEVPNEEVNIHDKIAKCNSCEGIFSFEDQISELKHTNQQLKKTQKIKQEILRPEGIELFYYGDDLEIVFEQPATWLEWLFLPIGLMTILPGIIISLDEKIIGPALLLSFLPAFIITAYSYWRYKKHRVFISVDEKELLVQWRPRKLKFDKAFSTKDITQIYVKKRPDLNLYAIKMIVDNGDGQKHINLTSIKSASKAKFLEQEIEKYLKIQDVVVPEES